MMLKQLFTEIANAIREKTNKNQSLQPINFASEIRSISGGTETNLSVDKILVDKMASIGTISIDNDLNIEVE